MRVLTGQVYLDEADAKGLRVKMRLAEDALTLSNNGEHLGSWTPLGTEVEEVGRERFRLIFGPDSVVFAPDDPVEFRYEIAPELGEKETRKSKRAARKAKKKAKDPEPTPVVSTPEPASAPKREQSMDEFLDLFKELAAVQSDSSEPATPADPNPTREESPDPFEPVEPDPFDGSQSDRPEPAELVEPDPFDIGQSDRPEPAEPTVVEPATHEPLVAPPAAPVSPRPVAKRRVKGPRHRDMPAKKDRKPVDPKKSDPAAGEAVPRPISNAAEKGMASAQAAAASLEKAKTAPAAISGGVRKLFTRAAVEEHRHRFESNGIPGGLVRHICTDCGHVSVDLRDEAAEKALENSLFQRRIKM